MICDVENAFFLTILAAFPIFGPLSVGHFGGCSNRPYPPNSAQTWGVYGPTPKRKEGVLSHPCFRCIRSIPAGYPEAKKYQGHGLDLSELVAIGNEGLLKAVKKFDPEQGVKFISYAVWWVRQAVLKALAEQTRSVRIPLNQNSHLIRMSRTETYLSQELGREPTDAEIAKALQDTEENVRSARRMTAAEMSLDAPIDRSDRDAATFGERFAGQEGGEIEERTDGRLMREFIDGVFEKYLTPRERKILYLYYGLEEGSEGMTLEKIGELMGVTRERIRQIRERAFEKLRDSPHGDALKGFWVAA
jgi:RNA polymerase primary sigma factor